MMMIYDYFIQLKNNLVRVSRVKNGELEAINIKGSLQVPLSDFWAVFKDKIEYEAGDQLTFIVLTDDEGFELDGDIIVAEKFGSTDKELCDLIFEHSLPNIHCFTFPARDFTIDDVKPTPLIEQQSVESELEVEIVGDSLQSFFRKKTREIERDNKKVTGGK